MGASGRKDNPFARPLQYLRRYEFDGDVYPVNPNYEELSGLRCYRSLRDVPAAVDLVLSLVPANRTIELVRECGDLGVQVVIAFASGFAEVGDDGQKLQEELVAVARASGVRVIGPNCQGVVYVPERLVATFTAAADPGLPEASGIAYVGQSGAVGGSVLDLARESGMGLTAWVSTGNQAETDLVEVGAHLIGDPEIKVLMLYLESVGDGARYTALAKRARSLGKHLVVLRSGRSDAGRRAVASHTGAMLAPGAAFDLVSAQEGAIVVGDVDELLRTAFALRWSPLPEGDRVALVTTSGGAGSLAADHFEKRGLTIEDLGVATRAELSTMIPAFGALANPVDVTAQLFSRGEHAFADVCLSVGRDDSVDILVVILTMVTGANAARLAADLTGVPAVLGKPLLVTWLAGDDQTRHGRQIFRDANMPVFSSVREVARTAAALVERARNSADRTADESLAGAVQRLDRAALEALITGPLVLEAQSLTVMDAMGVPHPDAVFVTSRDEAHEAAKRLGRRVAMKVQASELVHKSDVGGVRLDVEPIDAASIYDELLGAAMTGNMVGTFDGVLVQAMAEPGHEFILGVTRSENGFPPVLTLGFGGIAAEIYRDVASRVLPVDARTARDMLRELKGWPLLDGYRNQPEADIDALVDVVVKVGDFASALQERIVELEINPLIVHDAGAGAAAVDFMMRIDV